MTSHYLGASPQLDDSATVFAFLLIALIVAALIMAVKALGRATIIISGDDAGRLAVRMLAIATFVAFIFVVMVSGQSR